MLIQKFNLCCICLLVFSKASWPLFAADGGIKMSDFFVVLRGMISQLTGVLSTSMEMLNALSFFFCTLLKQYCVLLFTAYWNTYFDEIDIAGKQLSHFIDNN